MKRQYQKEELHTHLFDRELLSRLFFYLKPYRFLIAGALTILFITKAIEALVPVLIGYLSQNILNRAVLTESIFHSLLIDCIIIFFLLLLAYGLECLNVWIRSFVGQKATLHLRCDIFDISRRSPSLFLTKTPLDV